MKIGQIEAVISTFEVPGSKCNILLSGTHSLPGTSHFLCMRMFGGQINFVLTRHTSFVQAKILVRTTVVSCVTQLNLLELWYHYLVATSP